MVDKGCKPQTIAVNYTSTIHLNGAGQHPKPGNNLLLLETEWVSASGGKRFTASVLEVKWKVLNASK